MPRPYATRVHLAAVGKPTPEPRSRRSSAEVRHRVAQDAIDHGAVLPREPSFEFGEPAAHRFKRRAHGLCRNYPLDADGHARLLAREQDLMQALARPDAGEGDVDVAPGLEPGKPDHAFGEVYDLHRLAHVEHIDRNPSLSRSER